MTNHIQTGKQGEAFAKQYLQKIGYTIYDCNVRLGRDEIDMIAYDKEERTLVFVEVKTRKKFDADFLPMLAMTPRKKRALKRAAWKWMHQKHYEEHWRIDVICVVTNRVHRHVRYVT